jgi:hypothetical protein
MNFIFNEVRLKENFTVMNKHNVVNLVWKGDDNVKGLCKASKSGHGSNLFDKLLPLSYEDFYVKLMSYASSNENKMSIYNRGLTISEMFDLAKEFKANVELIDNSIIFSIEKYVDYIAYVNIIQTFDGHINEVLLVNYIQNNYYKDAHKANGELDSKYGVDILYKNNTRGIQVKSINFFFGNKQSVINDRNAIEPLKNEVKKKFGIEMFYAIFDRKNNKYLQSSNGTPVFNFDEFKHLLQSKPHVLLKYNQIQL